MLKLTNRPGIVGSTGIEAAMVGWADWIDRLCAVPAPMFWIVTRILASFPSTTTNGAVYETVSFGLGSTVIVTTCVLTFLAVPFTT